jgi:hypothetical protein
MTDTLAAARWLRGRGFSIIPLDHPAASMATRPEDIGKVPVEKWKRFQTTPADDATLARWFGNGQPRNIGIVTGVVSDLVVIDADAPPALRWCTANLPYTPWQTQTARGFHLFYRHPGIEVRNKARIETRDGRLAIDVRGDGGYVIAAGSLHASGATYLEAGDWQQPRESVPRFWVGWLARPTRSAAPPTRRTPPTGDVVERARRYLAAIPPPQIGQASDAATLYAACRLVRGFELSETDATSLLWAWCGSRAGWTWEWVAQKVQHAARYGSEPIGALR